MASRLNSTVEVSLNQDMIVKNKAFMSITDYYPIGYCVTYVDILDENFPAPVLVNSELTFFPSQIATSLFQEINSGPR